MKSNKKFPPALGAIVGQALKDKSSWKQMETTDTQEEIIRLKCEIEQLKAEQEVDNYLKDQFLKVWRTRNKY